MAAWPEERIRAALSSQAATLEKILADQTIVPQQALGSTHVVHEIVERVLTTGHQADAEKYRRVKRAALEKKCKLPELQIELLLAAGFEADGEYFRWKVGSDFEAIAFVLLLNDTHSMFKARTHGAAPSVPDPNEISAAFRDRAPLVCQSLKTPVCFVPERDATVLLSPGDLEAAAPELHRLARNSGRAEEGLPSRAQDARVKTLASVVLRQIGGKGMLGLMQLAQIAAVSVNALDPQDKPSVTAVPDMIAAGPLALENAEAAAAPEAEAATGPTGGERAETQDSPVGKVQKVEKPVGKVERELEGLARCVPGLSLDGVRIRAWIGTVLLKEFPATFTASLGDASFQNGCDLLGSTCKRDFLEDTGIGDVLVCGVGADLNCTQTDRGKVVILAASIK